MAINSANDDEEVALGADIPASLKKRLKGAVNDRGTSMKAAVRDAIETWLSTSANEGSTQPSTGTRVSPYSSTSIPDIQSVAADLTVIKAKLETLITEVAKGGHGQTGGDTGNQRAYESGIDQIVRESDADTRSITEAQRKRQKADHHGEQVVGRKRPKPKKAS